MQTKMMREALGDMYELCRDSDAKHGQRSTQSGQHKGVEKRHREA